MLALEMAAFWLSGQWSSATFVATPSVVLVPGGSYASWSIACADSDTLLLVTHGMKQSSPTGDPSVSVAPDDVTFTPANSTIALAGQYGVDVSGTTISITKRSNAGSGGTPAGKLIAARPHSHIE